MTKKIFRSTLLVAVCALLASLVLIMGCLYDYFAGLQSQALRDELTLAASGVSQGGETYLDTIDSNRYRLTWIAPDGTVREKLSQTRVKMRPLTRETIEAYVDREEPFDCAGSAKIEKLGIALMETVESDDPTSLIGLPLMALTTLLTQSGVTVLPGLKA